MSRSKLRVRIFAMLYRVEFHEEEELNDQLKAFLEEKDVFETGVERVLTKEDHDYIENKYRAIIEKLSEIDALICENTEGWSIDRISKVDLAIIRLAIYEMLYDDDIPKLVAIDEAVEISKKFGGDESPQFVNGVLAKIPC